MNRRLRIFLTLSIVLTCWNAQAENAWDGHWFIKQCSEPNLPCLLLMQGYNAGYLSGVHHGVYAGFKELKSAEWAESEKSKKLRHKVVNSWAWCIPKNTEPQRLITVIVKWYKDNPDKLDLKIPDAAPVALAKAMPCQ